MMVRCNMQARSTHSTFAHLLIQSLSHLSPVKSKEPIMRWMKAFTTESGLPCLALRAARKFRATDAACPALLLSIAWLVVASRWQPLLAQGFCARMIPEDGMEAPRGESCWNGSFLCSVMKQFPWASDRR